MICIFFPGVPTMNNSQESSGYLVGIAGYLALEISPDADVTTRLQTENRIYRTVKSDIKGAVCLAPNAIFDRTQCLIVR